MKIYQAGPLFSEAECLWHRSLKAELEEAGFDVVWPGDLISPSDVEQWGEDAPRRIMETDRDALLSCDAVLALLDGVQVDDGTAWEIGFAVARDIPVVGIRTDFRQAGDTSFSMVNAMIQGSVKAVAKSRAAAVILLKELERDLDAGKRGSSGLCAAEH